MLNDLKAAADVVHDKKATHEAVAVFGDLAIEPSPPTATSVAVLTARLPRFNAGRVPVCTNERGIG